MFIIEIVGWSGDKIVFTDFNPTFCLFCIGLEFKEFLPPPLPFVLILLFVGHLMVKRPIDAKPFRFWEFTIIFQGNAGKCNCYERRRRVGIHNWVTWAAFRFVRVGKTIRPTWRRQQNWSTSNKVDMHRRVRKKSRNRGSRSTSSDIDKTWVDMQLKCRTYLLIERPKTRTVRSTNLVVCVIGGLSNIQLNGST